MADQPRIFLCHASEDKPQVIEFYHKLKAAGLNPWLDKEDLLPGQDWNMEIRKALKGSRFVIIFFSSASVSKTGYVQREFKLALDQLEEMPEGKIYIIPVRLDDCQIPTKFQHLHYVDLFEAVGFDKILKMIRIQIPEMAKQLIKQTPLQTILKPPQYTLWHTSMKQLSEDAAKNMLKKKKFFDSNWNKSGKGIAHQYEEKDINGDKIVIDAATNLTWQQSGSEDGMIYKKVYGYNIDFEDFEVFEGLQEAQEYINGLNTQKFASFNDWRLPTLEEATSLMEPSKKNEKLYIDSVFDATQWCIWTADKPNANEMWVVYFNEGFFISDYVDCGFAYVRAVRS